MTRRLVGSAAAKAAAAKRGRRLELVESPETAGDQQSEPPAATDHQRALEVSRREFQRRLVFLDLVAAFPGCFWGAPLLAEDIAQQIIATRPEAAPQAIIDALRTWMSLPGYLHKIVAAVAPSINLDGSPAGFPSDAARADAAALLAENGGGR